MSLGFKQLRYFVAIANAGAVSRAAASLNIAQSALSHHIGEIEAHLGVKLFERKARGIALTAAGKRLYEHANAVLSALEKAEADVRTFNEAVAGPVLVGLSHTVIARVALNIMQGVKDSWPGVHLTLVEGLSPALIDRVLTGSIDLAITYNPPKDSRLGIQLLLEEELYLVGAASIIGRSSKPVAFADIPQGSVLGLAPVPTSSAIIRSQFLRNQIVPSATLEIDSLAALRLALQAGLGCAILARATVLSDLEERKYHARRIVDPPLTRALTVTALADRPQTRAFIEVRKTVIQVVRAAVHQNTWPAHVKASLTRDVPSEF